MNKKIASQLRKPTGFLGKVISVFLKHMNGNIYQKVVADLNVQDGEFVFEIGYGHGSGVYQIAKSSNSFISGIDFSEIMYKDALRQNKKYVDEGRVELQFGEFLDYPLQPNYYDKVFCVNVIYFWKDLVTPFKNVFQSLKKDGFFLVYMDSLKSIQESNFTTEEMFNLHDIQYVINQLELVGFQTSFYGFERGHIIKAEKP